MSAIKEAISAMKEVLLLAEKVNQTGELLRDISKELREHDRRIIRLETMVELARNHKQISD